MPHSSVTAAEVAWAAAEWLLAVAAGVALLLSAGTSHAAEPCEPAIARIVSLQGRVEVQRGAAGAWTAAALDDQLCIGDTIRVGAYARAALALDNELVLNIDQLTTLRLDAPVETGRSLLDLLFGEAHFFSHRPRALEIDTPIANAGAEGTEFLMRAQADRTEVLVFEGRVRLRTPKGELLLASGDAGVAAPGAAPRPEIIARPRDAVAWTLYYPPILAPLAERRAPPSALPQGLQTATLRVAANDYAGAIAALDAVPEAARDARYYTYRAGVLLNVGQVDEASQAIDRALALDPEAAGALAERAVIEVVQNRREEALADARHAVELDPDSAPARIALSYALQAGFDLEAARATLREAAERTPENALVQARLAEIELSFGDLDEAQATAERAVALAPDLARTQMVLGFAALTRIDLKQSKAAFERAIQLDSAEPLARLGLGLATIRAGNLEAGRRELEIAVALDPNDSLLRSYLGKAYFEEKRAPLDAEQYQIAKELDPNDPTPWFYDAIRLQTENRPVEALRNLETSIRLNDNRAVYRSRLLLDEDIAVRQTSLARIYNDLGFEQVALTEATKSLNADPANYSAHRFLSDTYAALPRHEIARASELLQSQLLQPLNINPVQPSLPLTDFNIVTGAGPSQAAFNEFTPLFARQSAQLTTTGVVGNNQTYAGESVLNMLYDRTSLSVGGSGFTSDGFRANDNVQSSSADAYAQVAVTPKLNLQTEYRYRDTDQGDLRLDFDPDAFSRDIDIDVTQQTERLGLRYSPSPSSDLLVSLLYSNRDENTRDVNSLAPEVSDRIDKSANDDAYQGEGQYLFRAAHFNTTVGVGNYFVDHDETRDHTLTVFGTTEPGPEFVDNFNAKLMNIYTYNNINIPENVTWTLGIGYDAFEKEFIDTDQVTPKFGVQWAVNDRLRLRAAAVRTFQKRALAVLQTLEPTQVAGFNQFFDEFNGTTADLYGLGLDLRITADLSAGVEASYRNLNTKFRLLQDGEATQTANVNQDEQLYWLYAYWTPVTDWALDAEVRFAGFNSEDAPDQDIPSHVKTLTVPITLRYFSPAGWFTAFGPTFVHQQVERRDVSTLPDGDDSFVLVDAAIGYRFPKRYGIVSLEVRNMFDQGFKFQDDNFRTSEIREPPYFPERTILGRLTVAF